jgi:hypothetical protein
MMMDYSIAGFAEQNLPANHRHISAHVKIKKWFQDLYF